MEQVKEYLKSPKKTAILGLIGGILMIISAFLMSISYIFDNIYVLGVITYFAIICTRLYKNIGNIKVANYTILLTYSISIIIYMFDLTKGFPDFYFCLPSLIILIFEIAQLLMLIISLGYFCNILLQKPTFFKNTILYLITILYLVKIVCYFALRINIVFIAYSFMDFLGYILIMPYFYNYYNILKGEKKNGN